jgi:hypothetical protein
MHLANLDANTRERGGRDYPRLLLEAAENGDAASLAA